MKFNYNLLNNRIAQVCESQQEFARRLGISFDTLQKKLIGTDEFSASEIQKGIELLSIPLNNIDELYFNKI